MSEPNAGDGGGGQVVNRMAPLPEDRIVLADLLNTARRYLDVMGAAYRDWTEWARRYGADPRTKEDPIPAMLRGRAIDQLRAEAIQQAPLMPIFWSHAAWPFTWTRTADEGQTVRNFEAAQTAYFDAIGWPSHPIQIDVPVAMELVAEIHAKLNAAPPASQGEDVTTLVNRLRGRGLNVPANLVEYMRDRPSAPFEDIIDQVHGREVSEEAVRKNVKATNDAIIELKLKSKLRFSTHGGHVLRHDSPE